MTLAIGHGNVRNNWGGVRALRSNGCDSIGLAEANQLTARLVAMRGYRATLPVAARDARRGDEVAVLTRRRWPSLGSITLQASEATKPARIAPDRWIAAECYQHAEGPIAHIAVHPNYVGKAWPDPRVPRVREYDEFADTLARLLTLLSAEGFVRIVTGDVNVPPDIRSPGWSDVREVLREQRMAGRSVGRLDVVAWDRDHLDLAALRRIDPNRLGSDHPGLVATFTHR